MQGAFSFGCCQDFGCVGQKRKASSVTGVSDTNFSIQLGIIKTEHYCIFKDFSKVYQVFVVFRVLDTILRKAKEHNKNAEPQSKITPAHLIGS